MFFLLGLAVGCMGTLVGAGGGFVLVPVLLFLFPNDPQHRITAISLLAVAFNASSGSLSYWRQKKIHWQAVLVYSVTGIPGAVLGFYLERFVSRNIFELIFGLLLVVYSSVLLFTSKHADTKATLTPETKLNRRQLVGGGICSFFIGIAASFLGIGGGIIHVPLLSQVFSFPVHLATGTSHAILISLAWLMTYFHWRNGDFSFQETFLILLAVGVVIGAQIGAQLAKKIHGKVIVRILALALLSVGIRLLLKGFLP